MTGQPPESLEASGLFAFVPLCEHFHRRFQVKNKLGETKAWASSATAKAMQAHCLCLAHNLMILCEAELARVHGVRNEAEIARRAHRLEKEEKRLTKENLVLPLLAPAPHRALGEVHPLVEGATLSPASPPACHRRPAPVMCGFARGFFDTVGMTVGGTRPVLPPGAMTLSFP
jgi:hypothetical protein